GFLKDEEIRRAEETFSNRTPRTELLRWIAKLHEERKAHIELEQQLRGQIHNLRGRIRDALKYLDGLVVEALGEGPQKPDVCPECRSPFETLVRDTCGPGGVAQPDLLYQHAEGRTCRVTTWQKPGQGPSGKGGAG